MDERKLAINLLYKITNNSTKLNMSTKSPSSNISGSLISFLYLELLLPWENGSNKGHFPRFDTIFTQFPKDATIEPLKSEAQMNNLQQVWKNRKDQYLVGWKKSHENKAKTLIYHLRNAFAHGDMTVCTRNKVKMIYINHEYEGKTRLFGQLTESNLRKLISLIIANHRN